MAKELAEVLAKYQGRVSSELTEHFRAIAEKQALLEKQSRQRLVGDIRRRAHRLGIERIQIPIAIDGAPHSITFKRTQEQRYYKDPDTYNNRMKHLGLELAIDLSAFLTDTLDRAYEDIIIDESWEINRLDLLSQKVRLGYVELGGGDIDLGLTELYPYPEDPKLGIYAERFGDITGDYNDRVIQL